MIEFKDVLSFIVGLVLFVMGLFPVLAKFKIGPTWFSLSFLPVTIFGWIVAVGALYLVVNSIIEITNSNPIGFVSTIIAFVCLTLGVLPLLRGFGIGPEFFSLGFLGGLGSMLFYIVFMIEGLFLMIAMVAMEM
ncbi:TPA: hypothetical protein HA265_00720 [Candidatus Woesearchaeota archaeon]|nr:hypothetical protein [Candidatus Woesearchaeota archaeon]